MRVPAATGQPARPWPRLLPGPVIPNGTRLTAATPALKTDLNRVSREVRDPSKWCVLLVVLLVLVGCGHLEPINDRGRTWSTVIAHPETTPLGKQTRRLLKQQPAGHSGFLLLDRGEEALLWRGMLVDRATRSIDAQYYIWYRDKVGTIAAERLLKAADRGVRIRVIVDELTLDANPRHLALLNDHPLVEIRLYNPIGALHGDSANPLAAILRSLGDIRRTNRRMHNKALIVDGSVAVVGGRNIADEYYDLSTEFNFRDRDLLAVGPIVPRVSSSFDEYWNSPWVVPLESVLDIQVTPQERDRYYRALHTYASDARNLPPRFAAGLADVGSHFDKLKATGLYLGPARLVYDHPGKNTDVERLDAFGESGRALTELALKARREVIAETPYLVMLKGTFRLLEQLRARGVRVALLTNSMAATDAVWVHSRYAFQRRRLLNMGVELYEYRPDAEYQPELIARYALIKEKTPLALHAKTMVIDRESVFVGSFNMDPRSTHLNTEIGLIIENPALAREVARLIEKDMAPTNSWRLEMTQDGTMEWATERDGRQVRQAAEPDVGLGKVLKFLMFSILPIYRLL